MIFTENRLGCLSHRAKGSLPPPIILRTDFYIILHWSARITSSIMDCYSGYSGDQSSIERQIKVSHVYGH